jgi:hypothetical protein
MLDKRSQFLAEVEIKEGEFPNDAEDDPDVGKDN